MAKITFKAKIETIYNMDETVAWRQIKVPKIQRRHCDAHAFRIHPIFRSYFNSDLFDNVIARQLKLAEIKEYIRLDRIPACVQIDETTFLATVTIDL